MNLNKHNKPQTQNSSLFLFWKGKSILLILLFFLITNCLFSQNTKVWASESLRIRLDKNFAFRLSYFQNYQKGKFTYTQFGWNISHRLHEQLNLSIGFKKTTILKKDRATYRLSTGFTWASKKHPFRQSFTLEYDYPGSSKYSLRLGYSARIRHRVKFWGQKWYPYADLKFYYFSGGRERNYYSEERELLFTSSPEGLHRFRLSTGVSVRPNKWLSLKTFLLWQNEFNLLKNEKALNLVNPRNNKVRNTFSNYMVIGISTQITLKAYGNKRKRKSKKQEEIIFDNF